MKVAQLSSTLCDPMDCSGSQARILEWVAFPFSRAFSWLRIELGSPALQVDSLPIELWGKPQSTGVSSLSLFQGTLPIQELNWGLLHCTWILFQLSYQGKFWGGYSFPYYWISKSIYILWILVLYQKYNLQTLSSSLWFIFLSY